ncbi:MAG TPA: hypothetical protein DIT76_06415 [Spartobacteria bacterium]|nr:hypothetical protein [Spartobacteria bacterium]HCP91660.1 hypothetical protein [Spartobacteria bacterium]
MFLSAVDKMDFKRAVSIWYRSKNKLLRGGEANWKLKRASPELIISGVTCFFLLANRCEIVPV